MCLERTGPLALPVELSAHCVAMRESLARLRFLSQYFLVLSSRSLKTPTLLAFPRLSAATSRPYVYLILRSPFIAATSVGFVSRFPYSPSAYTRPSSPSSRIRHEPLQASHATTQTPFHPATSSPALPEARSITIKAARVIRTRESSCTGSPSSREAIETEKPRPICRRAPAAIQPHIFSAAVVRQRLERVRRPSLCVCQTSTPPAGRAYTDFLSYAVNVVLLGPIHTGTRLHVIRQIQS